MKIRTLFCGGLVVLTLVALPPILSAIPEAPSTALASDVRALEYSWEHLYTFSSRVQDFDSDPFDSSVLYAGLQDGLYRSENGGLSWSRIGFEDRYVSSIAVHPQDSSELYAGVQDEGGWGYGLYRFSDGSWSDSLTESGSSIKQIYIDRVHPRVIYVAIGGRIHRSYDGGGSWAVGDPIPIYEFAVSSSDFFKIYAAAGTCGLYKSDDGGATWTGGRPRCDPFTPRVENVAADPFGDNLPIFTLTGGGPTFLNCLFRGTEEGTSETLYRQCIGEAVIFNPYARDELFFAGCSSDGRRFVKRSTEGGAEYSWIPFEGGLPSSWPGPAITDFFVHKAAPYLYALVGFNDLYWAQVEYEEPPPFLDLPVEYANFSSAAQGNYGPDTGRVNAWFDHDGIQNCSFINWRNFLANGCLETGGRTCTDYSRDSCYDSHTGTDFSKKEPGDPEIDESIFAAASGTVFGVVTGCPDGEQPSCGGSYGNQVWVNHGNGYTTLYAHLKNGGVYVHDGQNVANRQSLGIMGNSGNSSGIHLHLGLYRYQSRDGRWTENERVDPYGWWPDLPADPWPIKNRYLWKYPIWMEVVYLGDIDLAAGAPSGAITVTIPVGAIPNPPATVGVWDMPPPTTPQTIEGWIFTGLSFLLQVLEIGDSNTGVSAASADFTSPVTVEVFYRQDQVCHLNVGQLTIFRWNEGTGSWSALPTAVDLSNRKATAQTMSSGYFILEAPPLCAGDGQEPDDNYSLAKSVSTDGTPVGRVFDISDDEDWFRFETVGGIIYTLQTNNLTAGVDTMLELYDTNGVTLLDSDDNSGGGQASKLEWLAPTDGTYFIRALPASGSSHGCSATYQLGISKQGEGSRTIFLPIIMKNN